MKFTCILVAMVCLLLFASSAHAAQMFRFDLQSLVMPAIRSQAIPSSSASVPIAKRARMPSDLQRFGKGDHLILFVQPVTENLRNEDGISYLPVPSGLKLVSGGRITGVEQWSNPGPYVNTINEGDAAAYRDKVADAVKWAVKFKDDLATNRRNVGWLLDQLKARPEIKPDDRGGRDRIAETLCFAIAATGDKAAIEKAKAMRRAWFERQILDHPPRAKAPGPPEPK